MIDFRYLLTTIVAIFLALAIGLLIGSGLLADELADDLERQVQGVVDRNNELRAMLGRQQARIDADETFGRQLEPSLVEGQLSRGSVVLFRLEGTEGGLVDRAREAVELADGAIPTTITITNRMALDDSSSVEELLGDLSPGVVDEQDDLPGAIGRSLGAQVAADAAGSAGDPLFDASEHPLVEHGYIDVDTDRASAIPLGAGFIVAAGSEGAPSYDIQAFSQGLLTGLGSEGAEVVAVEGWRSEWNFVPALRDSDVRDAVATVDHGDTVAGAVSMVFELDRISNAEPGHYGFRDGAQGVAPESLRDV